MEVGGVWKSLNYCEKLKKADDPLPMGTWGPHHKQLTPKPTTPPLYFAVHWWLAVGGLCPGNIYGQIRVGTDF